MANKTSSFMTWLFAPEARKTWVSSNDFLKLKSLPLPDIRPEQQKIADCLSSIDELIAAEAQKLDTLKAQKKG